MALEESARRYKEVVSKRPQLVFMVKKKNLRDIEQNHRVKDIKVRKIPIWIFLRQKIHLELIRSQYGYDSHLRTKNLLHLLGSFFWGLPNWFKTRNIDYIFFNNADKRVSLNDKYFDIFFDAIADNVGQRKCFFIEWAITKHFPVRSTYSSNVVSDLPVKLISTVLARLMGFLKIEGDEVLRKINQEYGLAINYEKLGKRFLAEYYVYSLIFKFIKPKAIFVLCYYSRSSIVKAAKDLGIRVIEAQHGYVGNSHQFYRSEHDFYDFFPDDFISFGEYEKGCRTADFIFKENQIHPVGSFWLEHVRNTSESEELKEFVRKYSKVFCVTLQGVKERKVLQWVKRQAIRNPTFLFVVRPKYPNRLYGNYLSENVVVLPKYNIYEILKYSDYNITIYSTTAIEASFFNVKTLFYNINNLSTQYFEPEKIYSSVIEEDEDLTALHLETQDHIRANYFREGYLTNIKHFNIV
ncbi:hypothetical protein EDD80_1178 [Anseongella ginsenosidimutans]|uniref:Uncharacterized protein n=1 Tax=Anseongella ginsenosidimutans TaxID=496056 RepID=A0A4R3KLB4_9SPHI|nr:hypothetical protein [Anseongella ginsenosidimutans]QEC52141.1 hypothetical protein FRZ59_07190 [Anseongella ginsenosidimutans]TCS84830.1 hypothetical protein EDD80_1178 [Anseongella ginsenosidimutans]